MIGFFELWNDIRIYFVGKGDLCLGFILESLKGRFVLYLNVCYRIKEEEM